jgi:hypothetical protein
MFLSSIISRPTLRVSPCHISKGHRGGGCLIKEEKRQGREANRSPPPAAKVKVTSVYICLLRMLLFSGMFVLVQGYRLTFRENVLPSFSILKINGATNRQDTYNSQCSYIGFEALNSVSCND